MNRGTIELLSKMYFCNVTTEHTTLYELMAQLKNTRLEGERTDRFTIQWYYTFFGDLKKKNILFKTGAVQTRNGKERPTYAINRQKLIEELFKDRLFLYAYNVIDAEAEILSFPVSSPVTPKKIPGVIHDE